MPDIALGFVNTVDYEAVWDPAALETLIASSCVSPADIGPKARIRTLRDLLGSTLWHFSEGTGCGQYVEDPAALDALLDILCCRTTLGGTAVRAALALDRLGLTSLVHLVSSNAPTRRLLPASVETVCSGKGEVLSPHVTIQFPAGAQLHVSGRTLTAPRANRVIYTSDLDAARLEIAPAFFAQAADCRVMVLSSFDIVQSREILDARLDTVRRGLEALRDRAWVFYEDAHIAQSDFPSVILRALLPRIDVYSMNEDEFAARLGHPVDYGDPVDVSCALSQARALIPAPCLVLHTQCWALACGPLAGLMREALALGCAVASTRYRLGDDWTLSDINNALHGPHYPQAERFARELEALCPFGIAVQPGFEAHADAPTTIGLGDSFVGGFAAALARTPRPGAQ